MTTIFNTSKSKAVKISIDGTGAIRAMYVQIYMGLEQVLQSKTFTSKKYAEKWASNIL